MFRQQHVMMIVLRVLVAFLLLSTSVSIASAASGNPTPNCDPLVDFKNTKFSHPTNINNPWYSLVPGTQVTLEGTINVGGTSNVHRVVFTVTDLTKVINGVKTRVLWDVDTNNGILAESELAFQAQDDSGNVWVLGEYPEEYEAGVFAGAPSTWISGLKDAKGGVLVPGQPRMGTAPFIEAKASNVGFWDCGQVAGTGQTLKVAQTTYQNVLLINEWAPLEKGNAIQQKFYSPGTGIVQIGALNDPEAETLSLTSRVQLSSHALANAHKAALKLEERAYQVSAVYQKTEPAK